MSICQHKLNEELLQGDLQFLVNDIIEIDSYQSKMGNDKDVVVVAFTVKTFSSAKDLVNFLERGYDFILDAENTPGELSDGSFRVFAEIPRNRHIPAQIMDMLNGVKKLATIETFKFRYYKSFHSIVATEESLKEHIPLTKEDYEIRINQQHLNNFSNFFGRSYVENIRMAGDNLIIEKKYQDPLVLKFVNFGKKSDMYSANTGRIMIEHTDISEVMYINKYIGGNYNVTKINDKFIIEHDDYAVVVSR